MPHHLALIYDKSFLHGLSVEEANWLAIHFQIVITPILFVEVLGDLQKDRLSGRTPEQIVGALAKKTNPDAWVNADAQSMIIQDLLVGDVEMKGRPLIPRENTNYVQDAQGKVALFMDEPKEIKRFHCWQRQEFDELEKAMASEWKAEISDVKVAEFAKQFGVKKSQFVNLNSLDDIAQRTKTLVRVDGNNYFTLFSCLDLFEIPPDIRERVIQRWKRIGKPNLVTFSPYAAFAYSVALFYFVGLAKGLISTSKNAKTYIDILYLFYLPFCQVFVSSDQFHIDIAHLFLRPDQCFVPGNSLKADLAKLVEYYRKLPEEIRNKGSFTYADFPPLEGEYLVSQLYDQLFTGWREYAAAPHHESTQEEKAATMRNLKPMMDAIEKFQKSKSGGG